MNKTRIIAGENPRKTRRPDYVRLPKTPITSSPIPDLTSVHGWEGRGQYGDPKYPGNCSGLLIRDLLRFFRPDRVLDPMCGSGTCRDVCSELEIECDSHDLIQGFDATNKEQFAGLGKYDFVWLHPPYWKMIRYSDSPKCLSNAPTLQVFLERIRDVLGNCMSVLCDRGEIALLMGDGKYRGKYLGLPFWTLWVAKSLGLWLASPEIIRFGHESSSARKRYSGSFIPRVHDVCLVLQRSNQPKPRQ